jgi:hypothetical protein
MKAAPLHKLPNLSWLNWVRLSMIPAGGDWRDLPGSTATKEGVGVKKRKGRHTNQYKVNEWDKPTRTITGDTDVQAGAQLVADPRLIEALLAAGTTSANADSFKAVADPRPLRRHGWDEAAKAVTGSARSAARIELQLRAASHRGGRMGVVGVG